MNHSFIPKNLNKELCAVCEYPEYAHSNEAECESCGNNGPCEIVDSILMCANCQSRNNEINLELAELEKNKINPADILIKSIEIDNSIQIRSDFFNSRTASIESLRLAIEADDTIPTDKKHFELAQRLDNRFKHLRDVLMPEKKIEIEAIASEQKAIQVYLNTLASSLRKEEREKLRLSDISYKPQPVSKPKVPRAPSKKIDKAELKKYAAELGINEYTLQVFVISKNITVAEAASVIREQIKSAKANENS